MTNTIKPQKTGPSAATTLILVLLFCMVAGYVVYQIVGNFRSPYETATAYVYEADDETTVSGCVVRDELLLPSQSGGMLGITRGEGERVAVGQSVATVYSDGSAMDTEAELDALHTQLERLTFALEVSTGSTVGVKLDSSIQSAMISMQKNLNAEQYTSLAQDISELKALVVKRDYSAAGASPEELTAQIKDTENRIKALEAQQKRSAKSVTVSRAGLFSAVVDGYETTLTPAMLNTMTPSQFSAATADNSQTSNVGKLILGDTWYYAANMSEQTAASYKVGSKVTLRFVKELNRNLTMTVYRISDTENGQKLVVFSSNEYLPEVTLLRHSSASIIHESFSGIRVPVEALRMEDGVTGVYCLVGMQAVFKPVDIVYQGSGYYLLKPAKKADDTENTSSSRLRIGDSVIITAEELYNGKVIE